MQVFVRSTQSSQSDQRRQNKIHSCILNKSGTTKILGTEWLLANHVKQLRYSCLSFGVSMPFKFNIGKQVATNPKGKLKRSCSHHMNTKQKFIALLQDYLLNTIIIVPIILNITIDVLTGTLRTLA